MRRASPSECPTLVRVPVAHPAPPSGNRPGRRWRTVVAAAGVAVALVAAFVVADARRSGRALTDRSVRVGDAASPTNDPGDAEPFAPFSFAVIGPVNGRHAALDRARSEIDVRGGADFVVLRGDVGPGSLLVADALEGTARVALPGPADEADADAFHALVSPSRWFFVHHECLFTGVTGNRGDDEAFVARADPEARTARHAFAFRLDDHGGLPVAGDDELGILLVHVGDTVTRDPFIVPTAMSAAGAYRHVRLVWLFPRVGDNDVAFAFTLVLCVATAGAALHLAIRATPRVHLS